MQHPVTNPALISLGQRSADRLARVLHCGRQEFNRAHPHHGIAVAEVFHLQRNLLQCSGDRAELCFMHIGQVVNRSY